MRAERCDDEDRAILREWRRVLTLLERDPRDLVGILGWPTLKWILEEYSGGGKPLGLDHAEMQRLNYDFHQIDFGKSLYYQLLPDFERITTDEEIRYAAMHPPETRAKLRVATARKALVRGIDFIPCWDRVLVADRERRGERFLWQIPTHEHSPTLTRKAGLL